MQLQSRRGGTQHNKVCFGNQRQPVLCLNEPFHEWRKSVDAFMGQLIQLWDGNNTYSLSDTFSNTRLSVSGDSQQNWLA